LGFYVSVVVVCAVQLLFGRKYFTEFNGTKRKEAEEGGEEEKSYHYLMKNRLISTREG